jgi:hypothetical protein
MDFYKEYQKCLNDVVYFAENHIEIRDVDGKYQKLTLYPFQRGILWNMQQNNRFLLNACRQSGKSLMGEIFGLWYAMFHPDKTIIHVVRKKDDIKNVRSMVNFEKIKENLTRDNIDNLKFENGSTITYVSEAGCLNGSMRGRNPDLIDFQEFAYFQNQEDMLDGIYPLVSHPKNLKKVFLISTKNKEDDVFYKLYMESKKSDCVFKSQSVNWWDIPNWDLKWKNDMNKNISNYHFDKEFTSDF